MHKLFLVFKFLKSDKFSAYKWTSKQTLGIILKDIIFKPYTSHILYNDLIQNKYTFLFSNAHDKTYNENILFSVSIKNNTCSFINEYFHFIC